MPNENHPIYESSVPETPACPGCGRTESMDITWYPDGSNGWQCTALDCMTSIDDDIE